LEAETMSVRELEDRSEKERQSIVNGVGELQQRLSPGQLLDRFLSAGSAGSDYWSRARHEVSDNPLLASLAGTGLAWLLFSKRKIKSTGDAVKKAAEDTEAEVRADAEEVRRESASSIDFAKESASSIAEKIERGMKAVTDSTVAAVESAKDRIAEQGTAVAASGRKVVVEAEGIASGAFAFVRNEPIVLLGAGLALGAALGAYAPTTELENQAMGETSDALAREAKSGLGVQLDAVKEAGAGLYATMKDEIERDVAQAANSMRPNGSEAASRESVN
jgi:hypothetical protein